MWDPSLLLDIVLELFACACMTAFCSSMWGYGWDTKLISSWIAPLLHGGCKDVCCAGGAGSGGETGIAGRLRALLRGRGGRPDAIKAKGITPEIIQDAAAATEGFSGRELAKLVASMQASPAPSPPPATDARSLLKRQSAMPLHGGTSTPC